MSKEWLWRVPSGDGTALAVTLRRVQRTLAELAHDLPAGRASPQRLRDLATLFRQLATHLDAVAGISRVDTDDQ